MSRRAKFCPKVWDIQLADLQALLQCRFKDFKHRRERRLFDLIDINRTGYVTLDEIIHLRERLQREADDDLLEDIDLPLLQLQPDLSRSLVALYHFDVELDGHLTFEEFLLLQDYLRSVDSNPNDLLCGCIPKFWKRKRKAKKKKLDREMSEDEIPLTSGGGRNVDMGERLITRKINEGGELQDVSCEGSIDSPHLMSMEEEAFEAPVHPMTPKRANSFGFDRASSRGSMTMSFSEEHMNSGWSSGEGQEQPEADEEDEAQKEKLASHRAMLVSALKSNKGRKRFIEWLYKLADTTRSDDITTDELVVFLKAILADGINPEVFVDPAEDYNEAIVKEMNRKRKPEFQHLRPEQRKNPKYLRNLAERIMIRYNESRSGALIKEEFLALASMVEREYELMDNSYYGGDAIGPYRLVRTLGKGAEGVVKLGIHSESGGKFAVKVIKRGNIASMSRVDREVEAMVMLDHPAVVAVKEVLETESSIFLVMEFCAGGHLEDYISPTRPMSEAAARFYFSQLMEGLLYCHDKGVAHRDLRVENLMLDNKGNLKMTDFGHAGIFQKGWDVFQTMLVGSVSHLAPEQVLGTVYSGEKIDIWSAGIILYVMVMGRSPFQADTPEELLELIKVAEYVPVDTDITSECTAIIQSTLKVEQSARPPATEIRSSPWMTGPKEKLVLAHTEFTLKRLKKQTPKQFLDQLREALQECETIVRDKTTIKSNENEPNDQMDDEVEATVRTVEAEEEVAECHKSGSRPVSVTIFLCMHDTRKMVFKTSVTMMSKDAGEANLFPVVAFDLQSGEAGIFQRIFRQVRSKYKEQMWDDSDGLKTKAVSNKDKLKMLGDSMKSIQSDVAPLVNFAEATGLNRIASYRSLTIPTEG